MGWILEMVQAFSTLLNDLFDQLAGTAAYKWQKVDRGRIVIRDKPDHLR